MMMGLAFLMLFSAYLMQSENRRAAKAPPSTPHVIDHLNIFRQIERAEWDTLLFFYGIILSVGGLAVFGYLELGSHLLYTEMGASLSAAHQATPANITVGFISAILDNIPVMFAVLTMRPEMSEGQWLLVTLTAGIGGSLLSIGSAAGVALMGQAKGLYTFFSHLKWTWAILLGYAGGIFVHIWMNESLFVVK